MPSLIFTGTIKEHEKSEIYKGDVKTFLRTFARRKLTPFEEKCSFAKVEDTLDQAEKDLKGGLKAICEKQMYYLLRDAERLLTDEDYVGVRKLRLKYVGEMKKLLAQALVKLHLDGSAGAMMELGKGNVNVEIVNNFAIYPTYNEWEPLPPKEAADLFGRKVKAKIIDRDGNKVLINLITGEDITYYNTKAFAISGVEQDYILNNAQKIILDGIKNADRKGAMSLLRTLFEGYVATGEEVNTLTTEHRLETIVRTNMSEALNHARWELFQKPDIIDEVPFVQWSSIIDGRTTEYCREMDERIFRNDDPDFKPPPAHYNCRSLIVPITSYEAGVEGITTDNMVDTYIPRPIGFTHKSDCTGQFDITHYHTLLEAKEHSLTLAKRQKQWENSPFWEYAINLGDKLDFVTIGNVHIPIPIGVIGNDLKKGIREAWEWWKKNRKHQNHIHEAFLKAFEMSDNEIKTFGGEGSGNIGHAGIPGHRGGSLPKGVVGIGPEVFGLDTEKSGEIKEKMGKAEFGNITTPERKTANKVFFVKAGEQEIVFKPMHLSNKSELLKRGITAENAMHREELGDTIDEKLRYGILPPTIVTTAKSSFAMNGREYFKVGDAGSAQYKVKGDEYFKYLSKGGKPEDIHPIDWLKLHITGALTLDRDRGEHNFMVSEKDSTGFHRLMAIDSAFNFDGKSRDRTSLFVDSYKANKDKVQWSDVQETIKRAKEINIQDYEKTLRDTKYGIKEQDIGIMVNNLRNLQNGDLEGTLKQKVGI